MVEHDGQVGQLLKKLDDLGIANNTIVIYTTDNGAETFSWPDGGTTPFRGEKNTNWEGGYRVPAMVRWPGLVPPRIEINDIFSAEDWATTLVAAAGEPDIKNKLLQGYDAAGKNFKVHLDGYDQRDLLGRQGAGQAPRVLLLDRRRQPRRPSLRPVEGGVPGAEGARLRGLVAADGRSCACPCCSTCAPTRSSGPSTKRATMCDGSSSTPSCSSRRRRSSASICMSFQQFPPRQRPGSFSVEQAMEKLRLPPSSN